MTKSIFVWSACALTAWPAFAGERARNPSDAVVLVRIIGSVHAQIDEPGQRRIIDRDRIEIGSGSGFVISPDGYVLTNEHVIAPEDIAVDDGLHKGTITLKPTTIQICYSRESVAARGAAVQCSTASVVASDAVLDLAVLSTNASNLPYLAIGDSDVVVAGQPVQALGYPFGRQLSLNAADSPDGRQVVPDLTTTAGTVSAVRSNDVERQYLQITASVNPGNSGGPLVDKDGFVLGVIHSKLRQGTGIAFAIPINQAKAFFESRGLDHLMPVRLIRLGAVNDLDAKGLSLRLPEGFVDASPLRLRLEAVLPEAALALRVDRVRSPMTLRQIEQQLNDTQSFERLSTTSNDSRTSSRAAESPTLVGQSIGTDPDGGGDVRMVYSIVDLGREKLVARFVGNAEQVAFNESVLRASLTSLGSRPLILGDVGSLSQLQWSAVASALEGQPLVPFPAGWIVEPGAPSTCRGLAPASAYGVATPPQDFTLALRVAVWKTTTLVPDDASTACSSRRGSLGPASYATRANWMGVTYSIEGTFVRLDSQRVVQLEVLSTEAKATDGRTLLAAWVKRATN